MYTPNSDQGGIYLCFREGGRSHSPLHWNQKRTTLFWSSCSLELSQISKVSLVSDISAHSRQTRSCLMSDSSSILLFFANESLGSSFCHLAGLACRGRAWKTPSGFLVLHTGTVCWLDLHPSKHLLECINLLPLHNSCFSRGCYAGQPWFTSLRESLTCILWFTVKNVPRIYWLFFGFVMFHQIHIYEQEKISHHHYLFESLRNREDYKFMGAECNDVQPASADLMICLIPCSPFCW